MWRKKTMLEKNKDVEYDPLCRRNHGGSCTCYTKTFITNGEMTIRWIDEWNIEIEHQNANYGNVKIGVEAFESVMQSLLEIYEEGVENGRKNNE
jgi:hypothetical protein